MLKPIFFIVPEFVSKRVAIRFKGLGQRFLRAFPILHASLVNLGEDALAYAARSIINAIAWSLTSFVLLSLLLIALGHTPLKALTIAPSAATALPFLFSLAPAVLAGFFFFAVFLLYFAFEPVIYARQQAALIDKDLMYALKDLQLQVGSGLSLFKALVNISNSGYGLVSEEFAAGVKDINAGEAEDRALEKLANRTESELLRRAIWQLITALRSGATLENALQSMIEVLKAQQITQIKTFGNELNLFALIYLLVAIAVPGLGSTVLVVVSSFGGIKVNEAVFLTLLAICFAAQIAIIGYVKNRRPAIHF